MLLVDKRAKVKKETCGGRKRVFAFRGRKRGTILLGREREKNAVVLKKVASREKKSPTRGMIMGVNSVRNARSLKKDRGLGMAGGGTAWYPPEGRKKCTMGKGGSRKGRHGGDVQKKRYKEPLGEKKSSNFWFR